MSALTKNKIKKLPYLKNPEFFEKNEKGYLREFRGVGDTTGIVVDLPSEDPKNFIGQNLLLGQTIENNMTRLLDKANKNCEAITIYQEIEDDVNDNNVDGFYIKKINYSVYIRTDFKVFPTVKGVEKEAITQGLQQTEVSERISKAKALSGVK